MYSSKCEHEVLCYLMTPGLSRLRTHCVVCDDTLFHVQVQVPMLTLKVLVTTIDAQREGMGDVGSARYEPALLPPCPTKRVLSYITSKFSEILHCKG